MKRILGLLAILVLLSSHVQAQNLFTLLRNMQYSAANNFVDVDKKLKDEEGEVHYANVYTNYYKNAAFTARGYDQTRVMLLRLWYEEVIRKEVDSDEGLRLVIPINGNTDKVQQTKISVASGGSGKYKKLKNKYVDIDRTDDYITIQISAEHVAKGDMVEVYLLKESEDFSRINITYPEGYTPAKSFVSVSVPAFIVYGTDKTVLEETGGQAKYIMYKDFTQPPMGTNFQPMQINSITRHYNVQKPGEEIVIDIVSVTIPREIGVSADDMVMP